MFRDSLARIQKPSQPYLLNIPQVHTHVQSFYTAPFTEQVHKVLQIEKTTTKRSIKTNKINTKGKRLGCKCGPDGRTWGWHQTLEDQSWNHRKYYTSYSERKRSKRGWGLQHQQEDKNRTRWTKVFFSAISAGLEGKVQQSSVIMQKERGRSQERGFLIQYQT